MAIWKDPAPAAKAATPAAAPAPARDSREQRKLGAQARQQLAEKTRPLKRELDKITQRLSVLAGEKAELEQRLSQPLPPAEIAEGGRRLKACGDETDTLEERWLEISGEIEALEQSADK